MKILKRTSLIPSIEPFQISKNITYNELLREVDLLEITSDLQIDNYTAREVYYSEYTKKYLETDSRLL